MTKITGVKVGLNDIEIKWSNILMTPFFF